MERPWSARLLRDRERVWSMASRAPYDEIRYAVMKAFPAIKARIRPPAINVVPSDPSGGVTDSYTPQSSWRDRRGGNGPGYGRRVGRGTSGGVSRPCGQRGERCAGHGGACGGWVTTRWGKRCKHSRMAVITGGSVIMAMIRRRPWHRGQVRTLTRNTRASSCAHVDRSGRSVGSTRRRSRRGRRR